MSSRTPCSFYMRGTCRFGNRCWYSHNFEPSEIPMSVDTSDDESMPSRNVSITVQTAQTASSGNTASRTRPKRQPEQAQKPQKTKTEPEALWNLTNSSSGETLAASTPDNMLLETVKKLNEAENHAKDLREQLRSKNEGEFSWVEHQIEQSIDSDLQCNICYEMFVKPTVLNCSHTFCHECIESWTRRVNHCPSCRVYVKSKSYCLTLDKFLDKMAECLPEEIKTRRDALKVERASTNTNTNNRETTRNNRRSTAARRRNNRNQNVQRTIDELWGERDRDGAEWNIAAFEEAMFDPIRLGDVLGRNRNDRDDWDDTYSDSSIDSNNEYGYRFCSYCDNMGHATSNCPILIMDDSGHANW